MLTCALVVPRLVFAAPPDRGPEGRTAYVARALAAVRSLGTAARDQLDRDVYTGARTRCHAETAAPSAPCLIEAAQAACATSADRATCEVVADVISTNLRGADDFVDEPARARLVRGSSDYRAALATELHRRYAFLAVELALGSPAAGEATAIDRLCTTRDRAIHACEAGDASCVQSVPWSRCVAALIWFVGGDR